MPNTSATAARKSSAGVSPSTEICRRRPGPPPSVRRAAPAPGWPLPPGACPVTTMRPGSSATPSPPAGVFAAETRLSTLARSMIRVAARSSPRRLRSSAMASDLRGPGHSTSSRSTITGPSSRAVTVRTARPSTRARAIAGAASAMASFSLRTGRRGEQGSYERRLAAVLVAKHVRVHADPLGLLGLGAARGGPVGEHPLPLGQLGVVRQLHLALLELRHVGVLALLEPHDDERPADLERSGDRRRVGQREGRLGERGRDADPFDDGSLAAGAQREQPRLLDARRSAAPRGPRRASSLSLGGRREERPSSTCRASPSACRRRRRPRSWPARRRAPRAASARPAPAWPARTRRCRCAAPRPW